MTLQQAVLAKTPSSHLEEAAAMLLWALPLCPLPGTARSPRHCCHHWWWGQDPVAGRCQNCAAVCSEVPPAPSGYVYRVVLKQCGFLYACLLP